MQTITGMERKTRRPTALFLLASFVFLLVSIAGGHLVAQDPSQKTFASPGEAVQSMIKAVKSGDNDQLMQIFGPQAKEILSSGDPVADKAARENVLEKYNEMNRLVIEPDKSVTLYLGAENWPFPISLENKNGAWFFDSAAGKKEILYRRIGRNEFDTIDTLNALVDAQKEYFGQLHDGETVRQYAQKLMSDEGKHNGLYWKTTSGEPQSPIGPLLAEAAAAGYRKKEGGPTPFHGYIFRLVTSQGKNAPGGAKDYMVNGRLIKGFAIVACPVEYRNSGVMTFVVNQDGKIYQKDLGPQTEATASAMTAFNPDKTWLLTD